MIILIIKIIIMITRKLNFCVIKIRKKPQDNIVIVIVNNNINISNINNISNIDENNNENNNEVENDK